MAQPEPCPECGLPLVECSAIAAGRIEAEAWLRAHGVTGRVARQRANELIPHPRKPSAAEHPCVDRCKAGCTSRGPDTDPHCMDITRA